MTTTNTPSERRHGGSADRARPLAGAKVLLVEDEPLVSLLAEDMLQSFGCRTVWHAPDLASARELLAQELPHAAVLDVNLAGELVFPLAEHLEALGIPFVFVTGYGRRGIPSRWAAVPVISKPYDQSTFAAVLRERGILAPADEVDAGATA